jgi:hypothetical protein
MLSTSGFTPTLHYPFKKNNSELLWQKTCYVLWGIIWPERFGRIDDKLFCPCFTTCFASLSELLWQKLAYCIGIISWWNWFRLMTFCPCSLSVGKEICPFKFRYRHLTGAECHQILTHSGKKNDNSPGPFQSSSSSSYCHWILFFSNQEAEYHWPGPVLDRMAPKRDHSVVHDHHHSWLTVIFWGKKIVGFWDNKKVEKFLEKCV